MRPSIPHSRFFLFAASSLGFASCLQAQAAAADPRALDGIAHVAFRVVDVPASREFYQKLGFEQAFEFGDARGTSVSYMKVNDRQFIELYRRGQPSEPLGLMHICFDTSDIARVHDAYVKRGLKPRDVVKARAGNLLFSLHDPEGQLLEYTEYLPGSLHSNERGKHLGKDRISDHMVCASAPVKDLAAERAFYIGTLGFEDLARDGVARLRAPGSSGEVVQLEPSTSDWKPRIEFAVADVPRTRDELRKRGLAVRMSGGAALVTDPDGAVIVFTASGKR